MAGTLVSYLPFTRSVTEDLSGKEWTVTGEPQIITLSQFPYKAAQFEPGQKITSNIEHGGSSTWMVEFWCFIPPITTSWESIIWTGSDDLFFNMLSIDSDGKLTVWSNTNETFSGSSAFINKSDNTYFNRWIKIQFGWIYATPVFGASADIYDYNDQHIEYFNTASLYNSPRVTSPISTSGIIQLASNITMKIGQFRYYSSINQRRYDYEFFPSIATTLPTDNIISNELLVHDTINFESRNNISYTSRNKSQQWYYKNIGTADGLLVSGTSLTNVPPSKSVTSKAFYQTNRQKCFDTQASKEIYMLFDVYFDGTNRWRAYEESSTNGITGITAQTSGEVNIFSNGTNVGASIPLTINKLETYLLHMRSDATNGYIEVFKDGELKYTYIGNVNNGDDFSNLELQSDGYGTVFSNIVISNQPIDNADRWTGNYTTIQRTLTNETWVPEKCLKALLPQIQSMDLCGNMWTAAGNVSTSSDINKEGISSIHLPNGAYFVANDIINLNTEKWTFDCWAYLVSSSGENGYFALSAKTNDYRCGIIFGNDGIFVADGTSGWQAKNTSITFPSVKNQWVHLAVVKNDQQVTFYQNGTSVWSFQTTRLDNSGKFILGGSAYGYNTDIYFNQVRFLKDTALWTENFIPPTTEDYTTYRQQLTSNTAFKDNVASWLAFDPLTDLCGNPWNTYKNPSVTQTNFLNGKAISLSNNAYLEYQNRITLGGKSFTISGWFNMDSNTGTWSRIFQLFTETSSETNTIRMARNSTSKKLSFTFYNTTLTSFNYNISYNTWYHFAFVYDQNNSKVYIYINGQQISSGNQTIPSTTFTLYLGKSNFNDGLFVGQIAEFMIHDNVALYTENFTPPTQEDYFETYWHFNKPAPILNTNYNIQRTLTNETWVPENCLKAYLPCTNTITEDFCGNTWTVTGTTPTIVTTNYLNGKAAQFGQGYIYTNPPALRSNNFTIDFWEYIPSTVNGLTAQMVVIDGTDGTGTQCLNIGYDNGATVPSFWLGKGTSSGWIYSNKIIGTKIRGQWVHRAVVRYNDKIYAFENGKLYTSFDIESNMYIDITGSSLFIGGFKRASRLHPGMLNEVRIYVGTALWTTNFTPPTQEDYFETYWYFNQPAPVVYLGSILRELTNASKIWKYINPGYMDLCSGTDDTGYISSIITNDSDVPVYFTNNRDYNDSAFITLTNMKYPTDDEIWVKWSKPSTSTNNFYTIRIIDENGESIRFIAYSGWQGSVSHPVATLDSLTQPDKKISPITEAATYILHVKSHPTRGIIELFENNQLIGELTGNIQDGAKLSHVDVVIYDDITNGNLYNFIISNGGLADKDTIANNINPVQKTTNNNEEYRIAKYCLKSWMMFDESPTKDLCGNTWTAYNNPSIIDTDVLHGKALQLNSGQYLYLPNTIAIGGNRDLTICGWYNMSTSSGTWASLFTFWQNTNNGPIIKLSKNAYYDELAWAFSQGTYTFLGNANIDNKLHHFAYVYQAETKTISIYIDGKTYIDAKKMSLAMSTEVKRYNYKIYLGKSNFTADKAYVGTINEFMVYDGLALYTEEFTPPVHKITDDKLYYDKSEETMKFEYFADVQKTTWKIVEPTSKKILVSYLPFDGDVKDLCDDERVIYKDGSTPVFSSQDSTKNKSLSLSSYDGSSYGTRGYTADFELLPYDKSWKFIAELDIIANLPGDSFTANKYIDILKISSDSTVIVNILYWNPNYSYYSQTSNVAKLFIRNERNFSNPPDTFIDDYTLTAQSKESFHVTIIFDNDELNPSTMIFLKPLDGGNVYIYRLIGDNILRDNKSYWIKFGGTYNATNGLNINIDEFKFYLDYNDSTPTTIIDKNIEVRFNNGEESVYFEFYANTTTAKSAYLNIFTTSNLLFWAAPRGISSDDRAIKLRGTQPSLFTDGVIKEAVSNSISSVISPDLNAKFAGPDLSIKKLEWDLRPLSVDPFDKITFTIWFSKIKKDIDEDLNYSVINLYAVYDEKYDPILCLIIKHDRIKILADYDLVDEIPIEFLNVYHLAITAASNNISIYLNGKVVWYSSALGNHKYLLAIADDGYLETFGFGLYNTNIFENNNINIGSIVGSLPSYRIPIQTYKQQSSAIAIYHNDKTYYNKLVSPTDENASSIRIYHNNTVYALSK